ncbi:DUF3099 domain-containing protein [Actinoplanes sp. NPDC048796]|uniref:DUF3099 domain-containing protein n=1 Tax=unclassified Actinoplanes TaxID=2626549 RepID=UPI0033E84CE0
MKKQPVLITDAAPSPDEQYRSRQVRYVSMMTVRALCLIVGAILVSIRPPLLGLWLVLCAAGMVFLPWAAVLIANDRPAKTKAERAASALAEKQQATLPRHTTEDVEYLTIDLEPTDWAPGETRQGEKG